MSGESTPTRKLLRLSLHGVAFYHLPYRGGFRLADAPHTFHSYESVEGDALLHALAVRACIRGEEHTGEGGAG